LIRRAVGGVVLETTERTHNVTIHNEAEWEAKGRAKENCTK
jgi:hypothetical protein